MATWKVKLTDLAMDDYRKLDGSQKLQIAKQLVKLENGPGIGKQLGSKMGIDLTGQAPGFCEGRIFLPFGKVSLFRAVMEYAKKSTL